MADKRKQSDQQHESDKQFLGNVSINCFVIDAR